MSSLNTCPGSINSGTEVCFLKGWGAGGLMPTPLSPSPFFPADPWIFHSKTTYIRYSPPPCRLAEWLAARKQRPNSKSLTGKIKSTLIQDCRTGPSGYIGWRAGTTTLYRGVHYIPRSGTMNLTTEL
jgi:hypothetical protein